MYNAMTYGIQLQLGKTRRMDTKLYCPHVLVRNRNAAVSIRNERTFERPNKVRLLIP